MGFRIQVGEYRAAKAATQGPLGGTSVASPDILGGTSEASIEADMAQKNVDLWDGAVESIALMAKATKQIEQGEQEVALLNAEEKGDISGDEIYRQGLNNQTITVDPDGKGDKSSVNFEINEELKAHSYAEWNSNDTSGRIQEAVIEKAINELKESGYDIEEGSLFEKKIRHRVKSKLRSHLNNLNQLLLDRSSKAVTLATEQKADLVFSGMSKKMKQAKTTGEISAIWSNAISEFDTHLTAQVENNNMFSTQRDAWLKKIKEDYSSEFLGNLLDANNPESLNIFNEYSKVIKLKGKPGAEPYNPIWDSLPALKKLDYLKKAETQGLKIKQDHYETIGLEMVDDTNAHFNGAGGHLLITKIWGPQKTKENPDGNWEWDADAGEASIISISEVAEESDFEGANETTLKRLWNLSSKKLKADFKSKSKLNADETEVFNSQLIEYSKQVEGLASGFGVGSSAFDVKKSKLPLPENFITRPDSIFSKKIKAINRTHPDLSNSMIELNVQLSRHQNLFNDFIGFDKKISKIEFHSQLNSIRDNIAKIKNLTVSQSGTQYLNRVNTIINKRVLVLNQSSSKKLNGIDLYTANMLGKGIEKNASDVDRAQAIQDGVFWTAIWLGYPKGKFIPDSTTLNKQVFVPNTYTSSIGSIMSNSKYPIEPKWSFEK